MDFASEDQRTAGLVNLCRVPRFMGFMLYSLKMFWIFGFRVLGPRDVIFRVGLQKGKVRRQFCVNLCLDNPYTQNCPKPEPSTASRFEAYRVYSGNTRRRGPGPRGAGIWEPKRV